MTHAAENPMKLERRPDGVATLQIAPEGTRGSFTPDMIDAFERTLADIASDATIKALVLYGNDRYFSTGADFASLSQSLTDFGGNRDAVAASIFDRIYARFLPLWKLPIPTIAALTGHAVGGGMGIALFCDIRIVAPEAKMGVNFPRLGFSPGMGISYLLPIHVGVGRATEMLLNGRLVQGEEAAQIGLVQSCVQPHQVIATAIGMATSIAAGAPLAVRGIKETIRTHHLGGLVEALRVEARLQAVTLPSRDALEGIAAMMEKREPKFEGR